MKIHDIMTRNPSSVTVEASVREAAQVMKQEDVGVVPVINGQGDKRLVGVVTDRDIAIRCIADGRDGTCRVRDVMSSHDLATCGENDDVDDVMTAMRTEKVRRIPIVDERGSLVGIVSQADVLIRTKDTHRAGETVESISQPGGRHAS
jgi:CBS domain-containing protein